MTEIKVDFKEPIKAIIVNHGDHAYAKIRYDSRSIETFLKELYLFGDYLERCIIWRSMWQHVLDGKLGSM